MEEQKISLRFDRFPERDRETKYGPMIGWKNLATGNVVLVDPDKDPNRAIWHNELFLVFQDQAEYYAVCGNCRSAYFRTQWSGSTRGGRNWRERAEEYLEFRLKERAWCEFCDPEFGSGGWRLD